MIILYNTVSSTSYVFTWKYKFITLGGLTVQGIGKHGIFKLVSAYSVGRCGTYPASFNTS